MIHQTEPYLLCFLIRLTNTLYNTYLKQDIFKTITIEIPREWGLCKTYNDSSASMPL